MRLWPWGKKIDSTKIERSALLKLIECSHELAGVVASRIADHAVSADSTLGPGLQGGVRILRLLHRLNIRGYRLWDFYCYVVREDLRALILVLRAFELGLVTAAQIDAAIDKEQTPLDLPHIIHALEAKVPSLRKERREREKQRVVRVDWYRKGR